MPLESYLVDLIATAATGLQQLRATVSDADYRAAAETVADRLGPYVGDQLLARCELDVPRP